MASGVHEHPGPGVSHGDDVEERLVQWAREREAVRAVLLTSTRAIPHAEVDAFSDYDTVLVVRDILPFAADRGWIADFGDLLVAYWDPIEPDPDYGLEKFGNVTWYVDRPRIDFTLWPVALLEHIAAAPLLPAELDAGYRVLLDKDGVTSGLRAPTYTAYVPAPLTRQTTWRPSTTSSSMPPPWQSASCGTTSFPRGGFSTAT